MMFLAINRDLPLRKERFGVQVNGKILELPGVFQPLMERYRFKDSVELGRTLNSSIPNFADALGWTVEEVKQARDQLFAYLRQKFPETRRWAALTEPDEPGHDPELAM